jgi:hypothetical protein
VYLSRNRVAFRRHDCGSSLHLPQGWNRFFDCPAKHFAHGFTLKLFTSPEFELPPQP